MISNEDRERLVADLVETTNERARIMHEVEFEDRDQDDVKALVDVADLLWLSAQGAPDLADDPVAAMLGLVPDRECMLDPKALARARKQTGYGVSSVAERLRYRGWDVQQGDVFRWETRSGADVPPAVIQAIAEILEVPVERLTAAPGAAAEDDRFAAVETLPAFRQLVERWARTRQVSFVVAAAELRSRSLATVHRGDWPDTEQLLRTLEALVASVEHSK